MYDVKRVAVVYGLEYGSYYRCFFVKALRENLRQDLKILG